jgi:hypothetical protein
MRAGRSPSSCSPSPARPLAQTDPGHAAAARHLPRRGDRAAGGPEPQAEVDPAGAGARGHDPYDVTGLTRCEPIAAEIGRLDAALGPDLDEAPPPDKRSKGKKVADAAYGAGVTGVRDTTQHVLPFRAGSAS